MRGRPAAHTPRVTIEEEHIDHTTQTWVDEEAKADYESIDSNALFSKEVGVSEDYGRQIILMNKAIHEAHSSRRLWLACGQHMVCCSWYDPHTR